MTFTKRLQVFPPILCRLLARHKGGRPLTVEEICTAAAPGGSPSTLAVIIYNQFSQETDWLRITMQEGVHFLRGCGLSFDDAKAMRRADDYLAKTPNFEYLRKSPDWESYYKPLIVRWRNAYPYNIGPSDMPHAAIRRVLNRLTPLHHSHTNVTKA